MAKQSREVQRLNVSRENDRLMNYQKWVDKIPMLHFKPEWSVKVLPSHGGAMARFLIFCGTAKVSIFLDCYAMLGDDDVPYWEVSPHGKDVTRCGMYQVDVLMQLIAESIEQQ